MEKSPAIPENCQTVMPYPIIENAAGFISFMETVFNAGLTYKTMRDESTIRHGQLMIISYLSEAVEIETVFRKFSHAAYGAIGLESLV